MQDAVPVLSVIDYDLGESVFEKDECYKVLKEKILNDTCKFSNFKIMNDRMYLRVGLKEREKLTCLPVWKLWIPRELTLELISHHHDEPTSAYWGIATTLEKLGRYFYWPKMASQVHDYVSRCTICKSIKAPNQSDL